MQRVFQAWCGAVLFLGVALGAFGAHGLRGQISADAMAVYQTAVSYHMWHGLGLGLIAVLLRQYPSARYLIWSGWLMGAGILLFSGSLYLLAVSGARWWGIITPFGGLCFLLAWGIVAWHGCIRGRRQPGGPDGSD